MRTRTRSGRTIAAALAGLPAIVMLAVLTACSSTSATTAGLGASGPRNADYESDLAIVTCYHQHGDPGAPAPNYDPRDGRWHLDSGYVPEPARQACQHLFPVTAVSPPVPQAEFQELLRYAQCMRQHGVHDWPDPNTAGDFALPRDLQTKTRAGEAAGIACQRYVPSDGLHVSAG